MSLPPGHLPDQDLQRQRERIQRGLLRASAATVVIIGVLIALAVAAVIAAWRADRNAQAVREASRQAVLQSRRAEQELWKSRLAEARSLRASGQIGRREKAWAALRDAAAIQPTAELRHEAISILAMPDFEEEGLLHALPNENVVYAVDATLARYAMGQTNGDVTLHDMASGREMRRFPVPSERLFAGSQPRHLKFSPAGDRLGVVYQTGIAGVFDLAGTNEFQGLITYVRASRDAQDPLVFSPDGRWVGLVRTFGPALLYDLEVPKRVATNFTLADLRSISFHPRTNWVALGGLRETRIVTWPDGGLVHAFTNTETVTAVSFRPDGLQLAIAAGEAGMTLWNLRASPPIATHLPIGQVYDLHYSPSSDFLAAAKSEDASLIWDAHTGRVLDRLNGARLVQFAHGGDGVVLEHPREGIRLGRLSRSPVLRPFWCGTEHNNVRRLWSVDLSDDGRWMAAADNRHLVVWDVASGELVATPPTPSRRISVTWLQDRLAWLTSGWKGLSIWPMETNAAGKATVGIPRQIPLEVNPNLGQLALAADGHTVAIVTNSAEVLVLDLDQPERRTALKGSSALGHLTFSPDARQLASSSTKADSLLVWDVKSAKLTQRIPGPHGRVAWSPDGRWVAFGADRGYSFWDTNSWRVEPARSLPRGNLTDTTGALTWSRDGKLLAVAREREVAQLLDAPTGRELARLAAPDAQGISWLRFSADNSLLAVATIEGIVQLWDLRRLRERLGEIHLDWDRTPATPALLSSATIDSAAAAPSLTGFVTLALVGVALALGAAIFALQRQRQLLRGYLQLDALAERHTRELEVAQSEVVHAQKMKALGTLAAGIAHDFNNLLSVIRMSNQLTGEESRGNLEIEENVNAVEQAVQQGKKLVRSMLGYSREDPDDSKPFASAELVEDTVSLLSKQFLSGIALTLELDHETPPVQGSRSRLEQVLLNLIVNASEAMEGRGTLRLAVRKVGEPGHPLVLRPRPAPEYVELLVEDSGPGIDSKTLPRIFEPFFTTKSRSASRGTGLGLSLVYTIAEQDGLGLRVETAAGQGTTFFITIPVAGHPT